jgi:DNA topoisomerase I
VKSGKINASLPEDMEPEKLTLEKAVELLAAKMEDAPEKVAKTPGKAKPKAKAKAAPAVVAKAAAAKPNAKPAVKQKQA